MSSSRTVSANGIELALLEQGEGPLVVLCHGWPELSYSWRHQIPAIAAAGFAAMVPISVAPVETSMATYLRLMIFKSWI